MKLPATRCQLPSRQSRSELDCGSRYWETGCWKLESHKHGLRMQPHSKRLKDAFLNFILQLHDLGGQSPAAVHDCQAVLPRNPHPAFAIALMKARTFHEPGGRDLHVAFLSGILRRLL